MLVECGRCGAPLNVRPKKRRTKCAYCGSVDERTRLRAIAEETPKDFEPPKVWTPKRKGSEEPAKPLPYKPDGPLPVIAFSVVLVAVVIGGPLLWESKMWDTRPEVLERASLVGSHKDVAKRLGGKVTSSTQIVVPLNSDRYEELTLRYANEADDVPSYFSIELRHGKKPDEATRDLLASRLNGGLSDGHWSWGDTRISWSTVGLSADLGKTGPIAVRHRRAAAAWSTIIGAAFNPAVAAPVDEVREVLGGGYPVALLARLPPSTPIDHAKSEVATLFPGALIESKVQMNAIIPLDHPFVRSATVGWFASVGGTVRDVRFDGKAALDPRLDSFARCLATTLGPPRVTVVNPVEDTKSYTFHVGNAQIDVRSGLSMSAAGAHGLPETVDGDTWKKLVAAIDGCRS